MKWKFSDLNNLVQIIWFKEKHAAESLHTSSYEHQVDPEWSTVLCYQSCDVVMNIWSMWVSAGQKPSVQTIKGSKVEVAKLETQTQKLLEMYRGSSGGRLNDGAEYIWY